MLPTIDNNDYPKFVADQLLTAAALNDMFGYLDEQDRLTRANLLGIGIVCGLHVIRTGNEIEITKGCGITSEGYLVVIDDTIPSQIIPTNKKYTGYKTFDALKAKFYEKFVDDTDPDNKKQRYDLWELFPAAVTDATPLTNGFLSDKAVLIFVELREEQNKNCDPDSCDDKGIKVIVTFRRLLIRKEDAEKLMEGIAFGSSTAALATKPAGQLRRFDVTATMLAETADVFEAYQKITDQPLVNGIEQALTNAWTLLKPLVADIYPTNPFSGFTTQFSFLFNGSMTKDQLINFQYYNDFLNDLKEAYAELRKTAIQIIGQCCPDNLFPRHLLLGEATGTAEGTFSPLRNYFIPSPILERQHHLVEELRFLFRKIKLMIVNFITLPAQQTLGGGSTSGNSDPNIRITPSLLGDYPLSRKAIPFYYKVLDGTTPLYNNWNYKRHKANNSKLTLSYHAKTYNATDEYVREPLLYDLEDYNFLRIEGIIGKDYKHVLRNLLKQRSEFRLPFQVVALGTNARALFDLFKKKSLASLRAALAEERDDKLFDCHFQDLEALYDSIIAELTCTLCKEMKYFYGLPAGFDVPNTNSTIPTASLLQKCDPAFRYLPNTMGEAFEHYYKSWKNTNYVYTDVFGINLSGFTLPATIFIPALIYRIQKLFETFANDLNDFDSDLFSTRYSDLIQIAEQIKNFPAGTAPVSEDISDHLDALIYVCRNAGIKTLIKEYRRRAFYVLALRKLGYFVKLHPGIQHKAGVTMGGTFIVVYHEKRNDREGTRTGNFTLRGRIIDQTGGVIPGTVIYAKEVNRTTTANVNGEFVLHVNVLPVTLMIISSPFGVKNVVIQNEADAAEINLSASYVSVSVEGGGKTGVLDEFDAKANRNETLDGLIEDIAEGTVIADFYLPYTCCSDCPPIMSVVKDGKTETPVPVTISLEPNPETDTNEYCEADQRSYTFAVSPEGGTVTGTGVTASGGVFRFTPGQTAAALGSNSQKDFTFTYTKDGQTATCQATVYKRPDASFVIIPGGTPTTRVFLPGSPFGQTFAWDFGHDGAKSNLRNPSHDFGRPGGFSVTLTITNGPCSDTKKQDVSITENTVKTCMPADDIVDSFRKLESVDPGRFPAFKNIYQHYRFVEHVLFGFEPLINAPLPDRIAFLQAESVEVRLVEALTELGGLVTTNPDVRLLSLALYSILCRFVMYIACIQDQDVNQADVKMEKSLDSIIAALERIRIQVSTYSTKEKDILKALRTLFQQELNQLQTSGQDTVKPLYAEKLRKIVDIMLSMSL